MRTGRRPRGSRRDGYGSRFARAAAARSADGSDGDGGAAAGAAALPASPSTTSHKVASTNVLTAAPPTDADEEMGERLTGKRTLQVETPAAGGTALAGRRRGPTALLLNPKAPAFVPHGRPRRKPSRWGRGFTDDSDTDFSSSDDCTTPWSRSLSGATGRGGLRTSTTTTSPSSLGGARTSPRRWATTGMLGHLARAHLRTRLCLSSCVQGRCSSREWVLGVVARRAPQHAPNHHWLRGRCGM